MTNRIDTAKTPRVRFAIALAASLTTICFAVAPASADRRKPAPVVFAGQGGDTGATRSRANRPARAERRRTRATRSAATAAPTQPDRRVEFRYPDQPDTFYGAGGARQNAGAPPLSFSSSTAAISENEARQYALAEPSVPAALPQASRDPAITTGGFDARAAANRVAESQKAASAPAQAPATPYVSAAGPADFTSRPLAAMPAPQPAPAPAAVSGAAPSSGAVFQPASNAIYDETGSASVFDPALNGQPTANGEVLDTQAMIAAHPSLPLPSLVQVINLANDKEIVVRVNDRGPFDNSGLIEVSERAAGLLGFAETGHANVRVRYLGPAPHAGKDTPAPRPAAPQQTVQDRDGLFAAPPQQRQIAQRAPEPVLVPQPGTRAAASHDPFVVQLASFSDIGNAQRMHASLRGRVGNLDIMSVNVRGADYFRVVAGPVDGRSAAETLRDRLANQGVGRGLVISAK